MGCKNKTHILMECEEKEEIERDGWGERINLFILYVGIIYIILMNCM